MPKLTINTRKSEYSPIIVEINGKEFVARDFDKKTIRELNQYDRKVKDGDMEAPYRRLAYILKLKENDPIFDRLLAREVNRITNFIVRAAYSADAAEMENLTSAEKKKKSRGASVAKQ